MTEPNVVETDKGNTTIGEKHIYTQELIKLLKEVPQTETITYETMSAHVGIDVRPNQPGYGYQKSARAYLQREYDIVFEVIKTVGLRHMTHEEVALSAKEGYVTKKRRLVTREKRRINTVANSYDELTPGAKIETTLTRTLLAFDSEASKAKNIRQIEARVVQTNQLIGFKDTLALFQK
jgi:hypothetical protein